VSVARFELGEGDDPEQREARTLRQRQACDVIEQLLARIEKELFQATAAGAKKGRQKGRE
ncbi:MAG: hypothetical protein WBI41_04455, partial [Azovibrio sp.]